MGFTCAEGFVKLTFEMSNPFNVSLATLSQEISSQLQETNKQRKEGAP